MTTEQDRKAFEEWFEADAYPLEHSNWFRRDPDHPDEYFSSPVQNAWEAWEAAIRYQTTPSGLEYRFQLEQLLTDLSKGGVTVERVTERIWNRLQEQKQTKQKELSVEKLLELLQTAEEKTTRDIIYSPETSKSQKIDFEKLGESLDEVSRVELIDADGRLQGFRLANGAKFHVSIQDQGRTIKLITGALVYSYP